MKITVIGATSRIGRHLLAEAHRRDHKIVAFTRRPGTLAGPGALDAVVEGDGRDEKALRTAIQGTDAVISIVNGGSRRDPHQAAEVTRAIGTAMTGLGVRRLVVTSAYPIVSDQRGLPIRLLRRLLATAYADGAEMERIVSSSDLDWTIVRLNRLTDRPATGTVLTSRDMLTAPRPISRADVAVTLLDIVEDATLARTALNITTG